MALSLACGRLESVVLSFCIITRRDERGMGSQFGRVLACCKGEFRQPSMPEKHVLSDLAILYLRRFALHRSHPTSPRNIHPSSSVRHTSSAIRHLASTICLTPLHGPRPGIWSDLHA